MVSKSIDLNCDMGESFGVYTIGLDAEVMAHISSANIACGWHAGDPMVMDTTVNLAKAHGIRCGAHPGYPDLPGFGRRSMAFTFEEIRNFMIYQIGALQAFCSAHKVRLHHVKPHGALYNAAVKDETIARAIAAAISAVDRNLSYFVLAGPAGNTQADLGRDVGLSVVREAFPDRAYTGAGTLVPRSQHKAVISDPATVAERALKIAAQGVIDSEDGQMIPLDAQTLCVHGDTPQAVNLARQIKEKLEENGIAVGSAANLNQGVKNEKDLSS